MTASSRKATARRAAQRRRRTQLLSAVAAAIVLAVVVAFVIASQSDVGEPVADDQYADVAAEGEPLPPLEGAYVADDPAIGRDAPALEGGDFDGKTLVLPAEGEPTLLVFAAHWCPHCQAEVPRIVDWMAAGGPNDVTIAAVSTAADPRKPNWPPQEWLEREAWQAPVLVDDESSSASAAYGADGYPFFVLVDDGAVVWRASGAIGTEALEAALAEHVD